MKIHELLDEKGLAQEMDFRKKENVILKEIERVKAEIKEKNDVLS
jgi:hypothetical protein